MSGESGRILLRFEPRGKDPLRTRKAQAEIEILGIEPLVEVELDAIKRGGQTPKDMLH